MADNIVEADSVEFDAVVSRVHVFDGEVLLPGLRDVGIRGRDIVEVSEAPLRGRREVYGTGGWLMPGLIDTHLHFFDFRVVTNPGSLEEFVQNTAPELLDRFLERGITTIKSVGDPATEILELQARLSAGSLRGPRLVATGPGLTGKDGHPASTIFGGNPWFRARATGEVDSPSMMRDLVHHLADRKVDAIKLLSEGACWCPSSPKYLWKNPIFPNAVELVRLPTNILRAGIEAAHERGLRATVHTVQQDAAREALEAGADGLEHGVTVEPVTDNALIDLMIERGTTYAPTLWVHDAVHPHARPNTKLMADAGVKIVLGSDSFNGRGAFGDNTLEEAELMAAAGLTAQQILIAATSTAARHVGRADVGRIKSGMRADMILLTADPLKSVSNLRKLAVTMLNGDIVVDRR